MVFGDDLLRIFQLEIAQTKTVGILKDLIKYKNKTSHRATCFAFESD